MRLARGRLSNLSQYTKNVKSLCTLTFGSRRTTRYRQLLPLCAGFMVGVSEIWMY